MLKILVAGTRGIPGVLGGIETHCQELYPRLVNLGCRVTVVCRKKYTRSSCKEYQGVKLVLLSAPALPGFEAALHTLFAVLYAFFHGFRMIHLHGIGPALWAPLARFLGMQVVITHHGADYRREKWGSFSKRILKLGERWGVAGAHTVIAIAGHIKDDLAVAYRAQQVVVIPNGVCIRTPETGTAYVESLGLQPGKYFLAVSRFVPEKGLDDLIAAYTRLENPQFKLVLAGDAVQPTAYSRRLMQQAEHCGCVLTGYITGVPLQQLYSHSACFVLPSRHEGFSFALLEAAAYGLAILASDIPANRELELPDDCFFPVGNIDTLAGKLRLKQQGRQGREMHPGLDITRYDWDIIAKQTLQVYAALQGKTGNQEERKMV